MCGKSCAKTVLIILNFIFGLLGAGCLALGIWVIVDKDSFGGVLSRVPLGDNTSINDAVDAPSLLENSAYGLLVAGAVMFFISFMGCCGAMKEIKLCLIIYAIIIGFILLLQIAAGILAVFFQSTVKDKLLAFLKDTINEKYKQGVYIENDILKLSNEPVEAAWDVAQAGFECCGADSYIDWAEFKGNYTGTYDGVTFDITNAKVPLTCCKMTDPTKFPDKLSEIKFVDLKQCLESPTETNTNTKGCYESIKDKILEYAMYLIIAGIVIGVIELFGLIAACYLCRRVDKEDE